MYRGLSRQTLRPRPSIAETDTTSSLPLRSSARTKRASAPATIEPPRRLGARESGSHANIRLASRAEHLRRHMPGIGTPTKRSRFKSKAGAPDLTGVAPAGVLNAGASAVPLVAPSPRHITGRVLRDTGPDATAKGAICRRSARKGFPLRDDLGAE